MSSIKLTQYSHGAGCGCKIAPNVLDTILKTQIPIAASDKLVVGNASKDDAAVYDIGNGQGVISTTDFFMPIVDDPFTFGRIAATNAISDIYAMGGKPMMAIAILGWPVNVLAPEVAQQVVEGGRQACFDAGIPLAGGHSIDSPEPIFGLAVTGSVALDDLKRNDSAKPGDYLLLTKPLGIGVLSTAQKQQKLRLEDEGVAADLMCQMNTIGSVLAKIPGVNAITDVTGFGLAGHLLEVCEGSGVDAELQMSQIPQLEQLAYYLDQGCIPGGTERNFESYGSKLAPMTERARHIVCDPQTSGGLLLAVSPDSLEQVIALADEAAIPLHSFGRIVERSASDHRIRIEQE
ncbi:Selenide, water dikinase [Sinobacterium norvegicum]|uniref:Selenide, water dikinase n=1 Tax=Sinobacterium norvegicum TaxID=1641715 RepID=A0ABN8EKQ4_9GAMM|nr:selenide, water dikinase SelD [Sinobacterium norvegicum]CAH0992969.1 Selenide, water dikinase [Sinobacterium norvegicum]